MARAKLKTEDIRKVKMYLFLTDGEIDFEAGKWYLEGAEFKILHSVKDLSDYVTKKLDEMKDGYTEDEWQTAETEAIKSRFHLKGESDRMDMRRCRYGFTGKERS